MKNCSGFRSINFIIMLQNCLLGTGYLIYAIDGSTIQIPESNGNLHEFGFTDIFIEKHSVHTSTTDK